MKVHVYLAVKKLKCYEGQITFISIDQNQLLVLTLDLHEQRIEN